MKNIITKRISTMPTSIFSTMSRMALEYKAVNLGQGFPDFEAPFWIMDEAYKAMQSGKNQYAPMNGTFSLRNTIKDVYKKFYDITIDPDTNVTVTAGATEALFSTILALIENGDEVIMFEPFYDSYQADVLLAGGTPRYVTLNKPDFTFNPDELESTINESTKMIIVNNPHNPTGKVHTYEELKTIADLAVKHDLLVLSDEVYEFLVYDELKHIPMASLPGMKNRTITISSTGKTFSMTGWKIGWAVARESITEAIQKVHQWVAYAVNTPGQHAMAYALSNLETYLPEFIKDYTRRRDLLFSSLMDSSFRPHLPMGSYFMMLDIPAGKAVNDLDCAVKLVKEHGVATIPPSVFYAKSEEGYSMLRLCFAKKDETLVEGIKRLKEF